MLQTHWPADLDQMEDPNVSYRQTESLPLDADDHHPNQLLVAEAYQKFEDEGRMRTLPFYYRIVDVVTFTRLTRDLSVHLTDHCSERRESVQQPEDRMDLSKAIR